MSDNTITARAQIGLAFFYGFVFVGIFIYMGIRWDVISKFDVGLLTMFATGAMNMAMNANQYFFARQRPHDTNDDDSPPLPGVPK